MLQQALICFHTNISNRWQHYSCTSTICSTTPGTKHTQLCGSRQREQHGAGRILLHSIQSLNAFHKPDYKLPIHRHNARTYGSGCGVTASVSMPLVPEQVLGAHAARGRALRRRQTPVALSITRQSADSLGRNSATSLLRVVLTPLVVVSEKRITRP